MFELLNRTCQSIVEHSGKLGLFLGSAAIFTTMFSEIEEMYIPSWFLSALPLASVSLATVFLVTSKNHYFKSESEILDAGVSKEQIRNMIKEELECLIEKELQKKFCTLQQEISNVSDRQDLHELKCSQNLKNHLNSIQELESCNKKITQTLSETSNDFSRLQSETKTRLKAQEKVNTDLEDRLTDCENEIETLSANNAGSVDALEDNGFFAHPRRRNVASANEVNFSQAATQSRNY